MQTYEASVQDGIKIYNGFTLTLYDLHVLWFSNSFVWKCPASNILNFYNKHISNNHLDIGVGTGYYLDKCTFPTSTPNIALLDLNPSCLLTTERRISRYRPKTYQANVFDPIEVGTTFDSVGLSYLLHCLPGTIKRKATVFKHIKPVLNTGGVMFGTTILGKGIKKNVLAERFMGIYNKNGIFSNTEDTLEDLEAALSEHFPRYSTEVVGCVAFFTGYPE